MTHADEARRIAPPESYGTLCNEIAAALAASERAGWIAGRDAAADAEEKHHGCEPCGCDATPGVIARALLPAAVAEPAAKPKRELRCSVDPLSPRGSMHQHHDGCYAEPAAKCAHAKSYETMLPVRVCQACGARLVTMVQPAAKCAIPYCVDGFVPGPPNGEPEACPSCGGGA